MVILLKFVFLYAKKYMVLVCLSTFTEYQKLILYDSDEIKGNKLHNIVYLNKYVFLYTRDRNDIYFWLMDRQLETQMKTQNVIFVRSLVVFFFLSVELSFHLSKIQNFSIAGISVCKYLWYLYIFDFRLISYEIFVQILSKHSEHSITVCKLCKLCITDYCIVHI